MKEILIPENTFNSKGEKLIIQTKDETSYLKAEPMRDALKRAIKLPTKKKLFGQLWWENELLVVFATTGVGKTILGVQIAEAIASGKNVFEEDTVFVNEAEPMIVLYLDYELSLPQVCKRYTTSERKDLYEFHDNLIRLDYNNDFKFKKGDSMEDLINKDIERYIIDYSPKALIIDNLSVLKSGTENSKEALPLMQMLNNLKKKYSISILVIGHTPKKDKFSPININHLQGSAQIGNALDGCFAIAMCKDNMRRYIIELKQRNESFIAHADNVIVCEVDKRFNFLKFHFEGFEVENLLLNPFDADAKQELELEIINQSNRGVSAREIAKTVSYGKDKVLKIIQQNDKTVGSDNADKSDKTDKTEVSEMTAMSVLSTDSQLSVNLKNN